MRLMSLQSSDIGYIFTEKADDNVSCLAFSPNGDYLVMGNSVGRKVRLLDTSSGTVLNTIELEIMMVPALAYSPQGGPHRHRYIEQSHIPLGPRRLVRVA